MSKHVPPASEPHGPEPRRRVARPGALPPLGDLERLRDRIQERLDQVEALARERLGSLPPRVETPEQEGALLRRIAELEEAGERLRTQADRREQEWHDAVERLEEDRRLLADAWDRLERERIEGHVEATVARASPPTPADPPAAPRLLSATSGTPDDSVTQAILQQFQVLRADVRRTANRKTAR
jgi:DNA repair exonuclease SbcCD ATPase subunit